MIFTKNLALFSLGSALLAASVVIGAHAGPAPSPPPHRIPSHQPSRIAFLRALNDPFTPFAEQASGPQRSSDPSSFTPGPGGTLVPNPTGAQSTQSVVLCSTIAGAQPQAAFLIGTDVLFGTVGDIVAGYRIAAINVDRVDFEGGASLAESACTTPSQSALAPAQSAGTPATPAPAVSPAGSYSFLPTVPTPNPHVAYPAITSSYGTTSAQDQTQLYGVPAPTNDASQPLRRLTK